MLIEEVCPTDADWLAPMLKIWSDRYPFIGEMKGRSEMIRPKKIIICSNYAPDAIFTRDEDLLPIRRRFKVTHMSEPFRWLSDRDPPIPELVRQDAIIPENLN